MKIVIAFVAVVVVAYARVPKPCNSPKLWEALAVTASGSHLHERKSVVSYDEEGKRMRITGVPSSHHGDHESQDMLFLFKRNKLYFINKHTRSCHAKELNEEFRPIGIPSDAAYIDTEFIGLPGSSGAELKVYTYGGERRTEHGHSYFHGTVTAQGCIPIVYAFSSHRTGLMQTNFYNITAGIKNPDVFDVPEECMSGSEFNIFHF